MKRLINTLACCLLLLFSCEETRQNEAKDFPTPFELGNGNQTATYAEVLEFYMSLAREFPSIHLQTLGETDSGEPLHLVTYNPEADFNFQRLAQDKTILLILNGIHPGESDGIDASMAYFRDLAIGAISIPDNLVVTAIAVYNVGGALNRNSGTRANQNGPESHGFRGNARNYDLNRDFVKMDTRNARSFTEIFHLVNPDFFIDTHVSNGADYVYTLTHLFTQADKLGGSLGDFQEAVIRKQLEDSLQARSWPITPYVNVFNRPPDAGFSQFMDYPRYSTGFTALWNTPGLMVETHMLKPYPNRVQGTFTLLDELAGIVGANGNQLKALRSQTSDSMKTITHYPIKWAIDSTRVSVLDFQGYEADTVISEVSGLPRLSYDRNSPFVREIPYYNSFKSADSVLIPEAYLLPKQWREVRNRLDQNKISYQLLERDTVLEVTRYRISGYQSTSRPYEGHYLHYNTTTESQKESVALRAGDLWIPTDQPGLRYLLETLEPMATDSFFNWNFFDTVLQQKEGFSPYVFEDTAAAMLEEDPNLRSALDSAIAEDPSLAESSYRQLDWIFKRSQHYEAAHMSYPVYRVEKK